MAGGQKGGGRTGVYHRKSKRKQQEREALAQQQCSSEPSTSKGALLMCKIERAAGGIFSPIYLLWSALWLKAIWLLRLIKGEKMVEKCMTAQPRSTPVTEKNEEKEETIQTTKPDAVSKPELEPEPVVVYCEDEEETVREEGDEEEDYEERLSLPSEELDVECYEGSSKQHSEEDECEQTKHLDDDQLVDDEDDEDLGCSVSCSGDDDDSASSSSEKNNTSNDSAIYVQSSPSTPAPTPTSTANETDSRLPSTTTAPLPDTLVTAPHASSTAESTTAVVERLEKLELDELSQGESEPTTPALVTPSQSETTTLVEEEEDAEKAAAAREEARRERRKDLEALREKLENDENEVSEENCVYGRDYLYCVRDLENEFKLTPCPLKPQELLDFGICRSQASHERRERKAGDLSGFNPSWMGRGQQKGNNKAAYGGRRSEQHPPSSNRQGGRPKFPPSVRPSIERTAQPAVQLHKASNAWKPEKVSKDDESEIARKKLLLKNVRALMNKITPTTADTLTKEFLTYDIPNSGSLDEVIGIIFDKAVEEPKFCPLYSHLCNAQVQKELTENNNVSKFRNSILSRAQQTFSTKSHDDIVAAKQAEIDAETDPKKKMEKQIELLEAKSKFRRRKFGNITFIGQLYLHSLLSTRIIHFCLVDLLKTDDADEESIDCAVRLMETVGRSLQNENQSLPKDKQIPLEQIFNMLQSYKETVSSRIKFMIMNLFELRNNNWQKRKTLDSGPKKLDEIKKDMQKEQLENAQAREQFDRKIARGGGGQMGGGMGCGQQRRPPVVARNSFDNRNAQQTQEEKRRMAAKSSGLATSGTGPKKDISLKKISQDMPGGKLTKKSWAGGATGGSDTTDKKKMEDRASALTAASKIGNQAKDQQRRSASRASGKDDEEPVASGLSTEVNSEDEEKDKLREEEREKMDKAISNRVNCEVDDYDSGEIKLEEARDGILSLLTSDKVGQPKADHLFKCFMLGALKKPFDLMPRYGYVLGVCLQREINQAENKNRDLILKGLADFCREAVENESWEDYPRLWEFTAEVLVNAVMASMDVYSGDRPSLLDFKEVFLAASADTRKPYELYVRTLKRMAELNYERDNSDHQTISSMTFEELVDVNKALDEKKLHDALRNTELPFNGNLLELVQH